MRGYLSMRQSSRIDAALLRRASDGEPADAWQRGPPGPAALDDAGARDKLFGHRLRGAAPHYAGPSRTGPRGCTLQPVSAIR